MRRFFTWQTVLPFVLLSILCSCQELTNSKSSSDVESSIFEDPVLNSTLPPHLRNQIDREYNELLKELFLLFDTPESFAFDPLSGEQKKQLLAQAQLCACEAHEPVDRWACAEGEDCLALDFPTENLLLLHFNKNYKSMSVELLGEQAGQQIVLLNAPLADAETARKLSFWEYNKAENSLRPIEGVPAIELKEGKLGFFTKPSKIDLNKSFLEARCAEPGAYQELSLTLSNTIDGCMLLFSLADGNWNMRRICGG